MKLSRRMFISTAAGGLLALGSNAFANKSSVKIEAPETGTKGESVNIKLNVMHNGNNLFHHTDWVYLKINDEELKRWEYTWKDLPPSGNFTLEYSHTLSGPVDIEAQANCNLHGSMGITKASIAA